MATLKQFAKKSVVLFFCTMIVGCVVRPGHQIKWEKHDDIGTYETPNQSIHHNPFSCFTSKRTSLDGESLKSLSGYYYAGDVRDFSEPNSLGKAYLTMLPRLDAQNYAQQLQMLTQAEQHDRQCHLQRVAVLEKLIMDVQDPAEHGQRVDKANSKLGQWEQTENPLEKRINLWNQYVSEVKQIGAAYDYVREALKREHDSLNAAPQILVRQNNSPRIAISTPRVAATASDWRENVIEPSVIRLSKRDFMKSRYKNCDYEFKYRCI